MVFQATSGHQTLQNSTTSTQKPIPMLRFINRGHIWPDSCPEISLPSSSFKNSGELVSPPHTQSLYIKRLTKTQSTQCYHQKQPVITRLKSPKSELKIFMRRTRTLTSKSKNQSCVLYVIQVKIKHIIYQIDQEKIIYNMESSNHINNFICKNS